MMDKGGRPRGSYTSWYRKQVEEFLRSGEAQRSLPPIEDKERAMSVYIGYYQIIKRGQYPVSVHKDGCNIYLFRLERRTRT